MLRDKNVAVLRPPLHFLLLLLLPCYPIASNFAGAKGSRFDKSCDDDAGEFSFGILHARLQAIPLYEIRFLTGDQFLRMYAFACRRCFSLHPTQARS
jgi:hypothetical protein